MLQAVAAVDGIKGFRPIIAIDVVGITMLLVKHYGRGAYRISACANIKNSSLEVALFKILCANFLGLTGFFHYYS